jgi:tetratricopeptide (TPR) repeat protein
VGAAQGERPKAVARPTPKKEAASDEETLKARLDAVRALPAAERVGRLEEFMAAAPSESPTRARASELLTVARAALGDERLRAGDRRGGVELFTRLVEEVTPETSERLFLEVVARLPPNLYALGHREEALELARRVEAKARGSARRLLGVAGFYLAVEQAEDAARAASAAVALAPEDASARQALGVAYRLALKLDLAAAEYARAVELDATSTPARHALADLRRATGKSEEAAELYRALIAADAKSAPARAGLVLALFDAGKVEEAERELSSALEAQPENLPLLVGAAYHFAARGDGVRAAEFANRAMGLETRARWVWARLAYARSMLALKRPLEAEAIARLAGELGSFPTVQYELATALAASGFYEEAAEELSKSFALKDGQIETHLAGRTHSRAADFQELLAPELRASTFQHRGADTPANARRMKALLAFHLATRLDATDGRAAAESAREFAAGDDDMRAFRQLYVAGKMLERGVSPASVIERTDEAMGGVDAALDAPAAHVAVIADELREPRAQARRAGTAVTLEPLPRDALSKVLRGRIEELAGRALYEQGKHSEAVVRLKRATSVLPEGSPWWHAAQWRLGAALDAGGNPKEAFTAYVKAYRLAPASARRPLVEELYRRLNPNGSAAALERLLSAAPPAQATARPSALPGSPAGGRAEVPVELGVRTESARAAPRRDAETAKPEEVKKEEVKREETRREEGVAEKVDAPPADAPAGERPATTEPSPTPTPARRQPAPDVAASAAPEKPARTAKPARGACSLTVSEPALSIKGAGGSATLLVSIEGTGDLSKITATTPNWADILILAEPRTPEETAQKFTVTAVGGKAGTFVAVFSSPCGKREVQVEVK